MEKLNKILKNNEKAITLISLVVTIIVLLILAGISISMLFGDNGILQRATDAKTNTDNAQIKEKIQLAYQSALAGGKGSYSTESLEEELEKEFGENNYSVDDSDTNNWILSANGQSVSIPAGIKTVGFEKAKGDGNLSEGEGTSENPYKIQSIEDLLTLSNNVNGGNKYEGKAFSLEINLDFKNKKSYINSTRTDFGDINGNGIIEPVITELTTAKGFIPIGTYTNPFSGKIIGNNNSIANLYINCNDSAHWGGYSMGLFGVTSNVFIENLSLSDVSIYGQGTVGGLIGTLDGNSMSQVNNVRVTGEVKAKDSTVGGLVGLANQSVPLTIGGAENFADVNGENGGNIGGIVGRSGQYVSITNSFNKGSINASSDYAGGIIGDAEGATVIKQCYNEGEITSIGDSCGGIVGYVRNGGNISKCYNKGNIIGDEDIGGIIGIDQSTGISIISCYNTGNITAQVGRGIGGYVVYNCYNAGNIKASTGAGITISPKVMSCCFNIGTVEKLENVEYVYIGALTRQTPESYSQNYYLKGSCIYGGDYATTYTASYGHSEIIVQDISGLIEAIEGMENMKTKMNEILSTKEGWKTDEKGGYPLLDFE